MSYMLDTNICIHLIRHTQSVIEKFSEIRDNSIAISAITLAELEFGICNSQAYEKNRVKLISFLPLVDILSFDDRAAVDYGFIRADLQKKGMVIGPLDMLIAAHARSRNLVLVTNNKNEFERVEGLSVIDWV
jgi:tRNA(fMet)-specific endonuclease VapC